MCTLLAGNSTISLARSEEQINFSQQSLKMLKMASESFIQASLLFFGLFLKLSCWVPLKGFKWLSNEEVSMNYIQQTWKIEDDVTE